MEHSNNHHDGTAGEGLHVCPGCGSRLVVPLDWRQMAKPGYWRVWRRCPECEWRGDSIHGPVEIEAFEGTLEEGSDALKGELRQREKQGIEDALGPFSIGLARDLITADDFR